VANGKGAHMPGYSKAEPDVSAVILEVFRERFAALVEAGVTVTVQEVRATRKRGEVQADARPLWHMQTPVPAKAERTKDRQRLEGVADVMVTIDAGDWSARNGVERQAAAAFALSMIELDLDKDGQIQLDAANRPKLRIRKPDFVAFGSVEGLNWYGDDSVEAALMTEARKVVEFASPETSLT
jgi:hypothetical protein